MCGASVMLQKRKLHSLQGKLPPPVPMKPFRGNRCHAPGHMTNNPFGGWGGQRGYNLMDVKCCKVNNSIIHLSQAHSSVMSWCGKLNIT